MFEVCRANLLSTGKAHFVRAYVPGLPGPGLALVSTYDTKNMKLVASIIRTFAEVLKRCERAQMKMRTFIKTASRHLVANYSIFLYRSRSMIVGGAVERQKSRELAPQPICCGMRRPSCERPKASCPIPLCRSTSEQANMPPSIPSVVKFDPPKAKAYNTALKKEQ